MTRDAWRDAFVLELRLRDVPGPQIGDALAEVDAHCADSGQSPQEAFGDPVHYAATRYAGMPGARPSWRTARRAWWIGTAAVGGLTALWSGIQALVEGVGAEISLGDILVVAVVPPLLAGLVAVALRPGRGPWLTVLVALRAPAMVAVLIGGPLLAAALWPALAGLLRPDRVIAPTVDQPQRSANG